MIGGSSAPYLACTPCVPLFCTLFTKGENRRAFRLPGAGGDHFHCTVEPSPGHIRCRGLATLTGVQNFTLPSFSIRKARDTFNFLRHVMRATWFVRPKCSHRCVSLKETSLKPVQILKHTTKKSAEQTAMRTKWFKHIAIYTVQAHLLVCQRKAKEPKPKLLGPDILRWGGGLPRGAPRVRLKCP